MVSGLSAAELEANEDGTTPSEALRPVLKGIGLFVLGFTVVFVALGATASTIGQVLKNNRIELVYASGAIIIFLGVVMVLSSLPQRVWVHAGSGTLGMVSPNDRGASLRRAAVEARRVGRAGHGDGLRLRLDALHRPGPRRRPRSGQSQRDLGRRRPAPVRLFARPRPPFRPRRVWPSAGSRLRWPAPATGCGRSNWWPVSCSSASVCSSSPTTSAGSPTTSPLC